jgi:TPR repeat protein
MPKSYDSNLGWLQLSGVAGVVIFFLFVTATVHSQPVTNRETSFLPPDEVRRALQRSYVPPPKKTAGAQAKQPSIQPDPTAGAESRVELNAFYEAAEAWRQQGVAEKALPFYEKAGAKGHGPSLLRLGEMYATGGSGLIADQKKAAGYFSSAASSGDRSALYRLGIMHRDGTLGSADANKADSFFRQAIGPASRGNADAAVASAAALLESGKRLERDDLLRMVKLMEASGAGRAFDRSTVLLAAADAADSEREAAEDKAAKHLFPEPMKLREQAVTELQLAIDGRGAVRGADLPTLQYRLGLLLESRSAGEQDSDGRARELYEAAAAEGYEPARFRLERPSAREILAGEVETGESAQEAAVAQVVGDADSSVASAGAPAALIESAAEAGDPEAQAELGQLFLLGVGREKSPARAFEWFRSASKGGSAEGHYQLGVAYLKGTGTKVNLYNAAAAFRRAAEQGHPDAMYEYGRALGVGRGIATNKELSEEWLKKASAAGSGAAALALGREALRSKPDGTRDVGGAMRFFLQGARAGNQQARMEFLKLIFAGDGAPAEGLGGATDQEVFAWTTTLSNDSSLPESQRKLATYYLGQCYAGAVGTNKDLVKAAELFGGLTGVGSKSASSAP